MKERKGGKRQERTNNSFHELSRIEKNGIHLFSNIREKMGHHVWERDENNGRNQGFSVFQWISFAHEIHQGSDGIAGETQDRFVVMWGAKVGFILNSNITRKC